MELNVFCVIVLGFFLENSAIAGKHKVHVKIHVPLVVKKHTHTIYVKKKEHGHDHGKGPEKKKVSYVIHKHEHNHKHKHDHGHKHGHNHGHKHDVKHDHKHNHKGNHKHQHDAKKIHVLHHHKKPYHNDGYHKREEYQYETFDDERYSPEDKYVVRGSYKVEEKNPDDHTTKGYHHNFQYPTKNPLAELIKPKLQSSGFYPSYPTIESGSDHIKNLEEENDNFSFEEYGKPNDGDDSENLIDYDYNPPIETNEDVSYEYNGPSESKAYENYLINGKSLDDYLKTEFKNSPTKKS